MDADTEQVSHLERLADALASQGFVTKLSYGATHPYVRVTNSRSQQLTERVLCRQAGDGGWHFWWPWQQPIGPVGELESVTAKIAAVLRSVGDEP